MDCTERLLIVDGNNLVARSHFAMVGANLQDRQGRATGALYGTIKSFLGYLRELRPTHCVWMFDDGQSAMRTALLPEYKGHRKYSGTVATDPKAGLPAQFDALRDFFDVIGVKHWSQRGIEADDLIARAVRWNKWPERVDETVILSGDHDMLQLVSFCPSIKVHRPGDRAAAAGGAVGLGGRKKELVLYGVNEVTAKYGLPPHRLAEMWALTGDSGDNIKGIPGVGPKTAAKWMHKHTALSVVLANEPKCEGYRRLCATNLELIELDGRTGVVPFDLDDCKLSDGVSQGGLPWQAEPFLHGYDIQSLLKETAA